MRGKLFDRGTNEAIRAALMSKGLRHFVAEAAYANPSGRELREYEKAIRPHLNLFPFRSMTRPEEFIEQMLELIIGVIYTPDTIWKVPDNGKEGSRRHLQKQKEDEKFVKKMARDFINRKAYLEEICDACFRPRSMWDDDENCNHESRAS
jgi:hypothetical protein